MSWRTELRRLLERVRGFHAFPLVSKRVGEMSEQEAGQWVRLIRNMRDDFENEARSDAKRRVLSGRVF